MTNEVDTTQWSLPGPADAPRDDLKLQLEVYGETILLRGFESDSAWVRTVSADEIANVFTQHLGFSSGLLAPGRPLVEPGRDRPGGCPLEAAAGLVRGPATGGVQAPRTAPASHAGAGLRLLAGARPLGLRRNEPSGRSRAAPLPGAGLQRLQRREGLPRKPQVPRGGGTDTGRLLPVLLLPYRRHPGSLEEAPRQPALRYGRSLMEQLHTRLKTLFPSVRWPTPWRSPRGDVATASPVPGPVGYLVNHPAGLAGVQGIGYDYVLGSGGLYVQSESAHLTARVTVAPGTVRGLAPVAEKLQLTHGPIPASLFELGLRWFQDAPDTERFFAVRWDGDGYRLVVPPQAGTATRLAYQPPAGVVAEFHSHGGSRAFLSATDDRDEQGFRIYGVVGRLDSPLPELSLRVGVYGNFAPLDWSQVFSGPDPGVRAHGRGAGGNPQTSNPTTRR